MQALAHRQVLVKRTQAQLQVGDRQLTSALDVEKIKRRAQLVLINGKTSRAGKALEFVLTQPDDGVGPPARLAAGRAGSRGRHGPGHARALLETVVWMFGSLLPVPWFGDLPETSLVFIFHWLVCYWTEPNLLPILNPAENNFEGLRLTLTAAQSPSRFPQCALIVPW